MNVRELISELSKFDPDMPVKTEGCDCLGDANSVSILPANIYDFDCVLIEREGY